MNIPFIRPSGSTSNGADNLADSLLDDTAEVVTIWPDPIVTSDRSQPQPATQGKLAAYVRIGLVSVESSPQVPALLNDTPQSALIQRIHLPRNPRIASDELYELDGMDYLVMLSGRERGISRDLVRWLQRLKHLGIPMVILLPNPIKKRHERQQIDLFSQRVGVPIVAVTSENPDEARRQFVLTTMAHMPAMGLALAAHLPSFRPLLMTSLLDTATSESLAADNTRDIQLQFVHQMCAAHGFSEREYEKHRIAMETLVNAIGQVAQRVTAPFPIRNASRRTRFSNAVSTLLLGHAVSMYLGATLPSIRKTVFPQIWRLYRASRQSVSAE